MENPIVEAELQDICTFRQTILNSFQKINQQIAQVPSPLTLNSLCNCTEQNLSFDPFATSFFQDQPTHYFSQKIDFWAQRKPERQLFQKTDRINKYLNEDDLNNFNFQIQPLRERRNLNNRENNFHTESSSKNHLLSDKLNNSAFQFTKLPFSEQKLTVASNRRTASSHQNFPKTQENQVKKIKISQSKVRSQIKWRSEQKENILTTKNNEQPQKSVKKHQSFCESSKKNPIKSKVVSSKGFLSQRDSLDNKPKRNPKDLMRQEIYKRIKKRIYLSCAVYKSSRDSFDAIYLKQLRQRQDISAKIVNNPKVIKKYGSVIPEIK